MQTIRAIQSAMRATAPVVAIPVEGHAPFCVRAKLLKNGLKGVEILSAEVERVETEHFDAPERVWVPRRYEGNACVDAHYFQLEGPANRRVTVAFYLRIKGQAKGAVRPVRTSCRIVPLDRRVAIRELGAWSAKERERQGRKRVLAVGPEQKRRRELAKWATTHIAGDDAQQFLIRIKDGTQQVAGLPVTLAAWPERQFFIHANRDEEGTVTAWTVTEASSGFSANKLEHKSALAALEEAEVNIAQANRETLLANILSNQLADQVEVA